MQNHTASSPAQLDTLESRRLLAATAIGGLLRITGTSRADEIRVELNDARTSYAVTIKPLGSSDDGTGGDLEEYVYDATEVQRIQIYALDGNDGVSIERDITIATSIYGGAGNDTLLGGSGSDYLYGDAGEDLLYGYAGNDILSGGAQKNALYGGTGDDRLNGSSSRDTLMGEGGNDRLYGGDGDDYLDGGGNVDRLYGGAGNDMLIGGSSNDRLFGQDGNDTLSGGKGNDFLFGDAGTDTGRDDGDDELDSIEVVR